MFLAKLAAQERDYLLSSGRNHSAYQAMQNGSYSIVYHYDESKESLIYEAFTSRRDLPPYFAFAIDASGTVSAYPSGASFYEAAPLVAYLYDKEASLRQKDPALVEKKYQDLLPSLAPLAGLSPRQVQERSSLREEFLKTIETIGADQEAKANAPTSPETLYSFEVSLQSYEALEGEERSYLLSLRLLSPDGTAFLIRDLTEWFRAYATNANLVIRKGKNKFSVKLSSAILTPLANKIAAFVSPLLAGNDPYAYYRDKDALTLSGEQTIRLCQLLSGETISIDAISYKIVALEKQAGLFLSPNGSLSFYPPLQQSFGASIVANNGLVCLSPKQNEADLYAFPNREIGALYSFFKRHGETSFGAVKDLLTSKLVPLLGATLAESALPHDEKEQSALLEIRYSADIDDGDVLHFESEYRLGGKETDRNSLGNNLYYASLLSGFDNALEELHLPAEGEIKDEDAILAFLKADLTKLKKVATVLLSERLANLHLTKLEKPSLSLTYHLDYLSVRASCPSYSQAELAQILSLYRKKKKFVILHGKAILLEDPALEELASVVDEASLGKNLEADQLPLYEGLKIAAKAGEGVSLSYDEYLQKAFADIKAYKDASLPLDPALAKKMRPYQLEAAKWMSVLAHYHLSGILADDMGMGKTLESIAFISTIKEPAPILIVCPKSVIYNWGAELDLWLPSKKKTLLAGDKASREGYLSTLPKANDVYITSYDSLRNDLPLYEKKHFSLVLLDEGQYIKNAMAEKSKAVKAIDASSRFALTGTPIENSYNDLWSIFDFLMPGYLSSFESFQKDYIKEDHSPRLRKLIAPFLLRRKKEDYLQDLPKKTVSVVTLDMNEEERKLYDATLQEAKELLSRGEKGVPIFALLTKLREICVDSSSFFEEMPPVSGKLSYVLDALSEDVAEGHKILVFSSFTKVLDHLRYLLDEEQLPSYYIAGDTPASLRLSIADSFNHKDEVKILLVSLKAGGTGLNLFGADTVIHLDPWWNLASEEQATDRAYRIGQKRPVSVFKLVCHDSIEEKVILLQQKKKALYHAVIQEGDEGISHLSLEELMSLLS